MNSKMKAWWRVRSYEFKVIFFACSVMAATVVASAIAALIAKAVGL